MKVELYTVFYEKPYNPHKTYPRNANRNVTSQQFKNLDEAKAFIDEEVIAKGYRFRRMIDYTGKEIPCPEHFSIDTQIARAEAKRDAKHEASRSKSRGKEEPEQVR